MTDAIFNITDGTTTVSLINYSSGFHLVNWTPNITDYKGGGVFQDPPLADWRQLRTSNWANAEETFTLHINGANPDGIALQLQKLRQLLEKANQYWVSGWQSNPVYLEVKAKCETNTRYCLVAKGRLGNDRSYFSQPFTGEISTMQDLPLVIERRAWMENIPNAVTAVQISNEFSYDNRDLGIAATSGNEVYVANKRIQANITNVHITTAGANLMDSSPPYTILDVSGTNSTYFGIDTSVADSGPFDNLIFDIGTSQLGATVVWEYWNGAWVTLTAISNTGLVGEPLQFTRTGVSNVSWEQPSDWVAVSPGGALPVGYYVRARVTVLGSQSATQQNRLVYSQILPYVQIEAAQVLGDISALTRLSIENTVSGIVTTTDNVVFIVGLRSTSRGVTEFTSYINLYGQNPDNIVRTLLGTTAVANVTYPAGGALRVTVASASSASDLSIFRIDIDSTIAPEYFGVYHAYVRFASLSNVSSLEFNLSVGFSSSVFSATTFFENTGFIAPERLTDEYIDLGQVSIAPDSIDAIPGDITLNGIINYTTTAATNIEFLDLILIPVDEWAVNLTAAGYGAQIIDADSIRNPKRVIDSTVRNILDGLKTGNVLSANNGPVILQSNSQQRLYFFAYIDGSAATDTIVTDFIKRILVWRNGRYLSLRGDQ